MLTTPAPTATATRGWPFLGLEQKSRIGTRPGRSASSNHGPLNPIAQRAPVAWTHIYLRMIEVEKAHPKVPPEPWSASYLTIGDIRHLTIGEIVTVSSWNQDVVESPGLISNGETVIFEVNGIEVVIS